MEHSHVEQLIEKAAELAVRAHGGQMRKEGGRPYIVHPIEVALILARHGFSERVQATGLVHDVVEDTQFTEADIREGLGEGVAALVVQVTHDDALSWEEKKRAYIEMVRNAPEEVKAIATADKIANAKSLIANHAKEGANVWQHFNAGKEKKLWFEREMLRMLEDSWDHALVNEYRTYVARLETLD